MDDKLVLYEQYMRVLENINSPKLSVESVLGTINSSEFLANITEMPLFVEAIRFHTNAYWEETKIENMSQLEDYIRLHHIKQADNPLMCTSYNLAQAISRAAVHVVWRHCYLLSPQPRRNPKKSVRDPLTASHKAYREILNRLDPQLVKRMES